MLSGYKMLFYMRAASNMEAAELGHWIFDIDLYFTSDQAPEYLQGATFFLPFTVVNLYMNRATSNLLPQNTTQGVPLSSHLITRHMYLLLYTGLSWTCIDNRCMPLYGIYKWIMQGLSKQTQNINLKMYHNGH